MVTARRDLSSEQSTVSSKNTREGTAAREGKTQEAPIQDANTGHWE